MEIGAKGEVYDEAESIFCALFPDSGPFSEGERGWPSVDLGCTKEALILSKNPNQSTVGARSKGNLPVTHGH